MARHGCRRWLLVLALTALSCCAVAHAQSQVSDIFPEDTQAAKAFCARPAVKAARCGLASAEEIAKTTDAQCLLCGTAFGSLPAKLPGEIRGHFSYDKYFVGAVSLACSGRVVARSVFKVLDEPPNAGGRNCSNTRLSNFYAPGTTPVIRCELALPAGPGSEAERAVRSKEARCWVCGFCAEGAGCPNKRGAWYSDSFTFDAGQGCNFDARKGYMAQRLGMHVNPGTVLRLAKLEVCNDPGCFDQAYEDKKARSARKCTNGVCPQ